MNYYLKVIVKQIKKIKQGVYNKEIYGREKLERI